jgi:plastocyanin
MKRILACSLLTLSLGWISVAGFADVSTVTGTVRLVSAERSARSNDNTGVVVWLTPFSKRPPQATANQSALAPPKIVQKGKRFETRLLVVEVGSTVDFPNQDPFFHNVFSYYDGKRFDLGLYEAGATRSVQFTKPGVCYIFCNIHSQMSAVVVVVDTPFFVRLNKPGEFRIPEMPVGRYQLNVWAERCSPETLKAASRQVNVETGTLNIGTIVLQESKGVIEDHSNKYGKDYDMPVFASPIYTQP